MAKAKTPQEQATKPETIKSISVREVEKQTWRDFKKLAVLNDLSMPDYLKKLVEQEMKNVQISIKSK